MALKSVGRAAVLVFEAVGLTQPAPPPLLVVVSLTDRFSSPAEEEEEGEEAPCSTTPLSAEASSPLPSGVACCDVSPVSTDNAPAAAFTPSFFPLNCSFSSSGCCCCCSC